jgi:hypothetical protein
LWEHYQTTHHLRKFLNNQCFPLMNAKKKYLRLNTSCSYFSIVQSKLTDFGSETLIV